MSPEEHFFACMKGRQKWSDISEEFAKQNGLGVEAASKRLARIRLKWIFRMHVYDKATGKQIAERFGISRSRASQLVQKSVRRHSAIRQ